MEASKLKEILEQHKLWLETNEVQGERANLVNANLNGANLTGANLYGADLRRANLGYANLRGANLQGANLFDARFADADLTGADLSGADLRGANLNGANLNGANLYGVNLKDATGLPNVSWIIPGCLVHLNRIKDHIFNDGFYLEKEDKYENFAQDSLGFFIQDNVEEETFDILVEDRIIRSIPDWVKYSGLRQIATESV